MGGFLVCMGTLLGCEIRQLHSTEKAFNRWDALPWPSIQSLDHDHPLRQIPLSWDQTLRCKMVLGALCSFAALITLQAPLTTFGYESFHLAMGSVLAECSVGACVYGDLVVMAIHRTRRQHLCRDQSTPSGASLVVLRA